MSAGVGGGGGSLRRRASRGIAVSLSSQALAAALRLVSNLILSRLLFPEAFGLMAIVSLVLNGLYLVSDVGLRAAVIVHERGEDAEFRDTAWTLQVLRGFALWLVGAACAPAVAAFYGEPMLTQLIPAAAVGAMFNGLQSARIMTRERTLRLGRNVAIELCGQIAGLVAMLVVAWIWPSPWALVLGGLVSAATRSGLSHVLLPGRSDRWRWDPRAAREIVSLGRWVFVSTLFTYLALQVDLALVGRLVPVATLGVYSIGTMIANIFRDVSGTTIQSVMLPALAESNRTDRSTLVASFARIRGLLLPAGLVGVLGLTAAAPTFFHLLYEPRYHDASWIAQLSMIRLWFTYLHTASGLALLAIGDARAHAFSNVARTLTVGAGCLVGFQVGELPGLILGAGMGAGVGHLAVVAGLARHGLPVAVPDAAYSALGLLLGTLIVAAPRAAEPWIGEGRAQAAPLVLGAALLAPLAALAWRRTLRELRARGVAS